MFKLNLSKLESHLQTLVESSTARLFPASQRHGDLSRQLVEAMRQAALPDTSGVIAPNLFTIQVNPSNYLSMEAALIDSLSEILYEEGREAGLTFSSYPVIQILASSDVAPGAVLVNARHSQANLAQTSTLEPEEQDPTFDAALLVNAFLIVDGTHIFPLNQPVINIGRRSDNHLVLDDVRVSRTHAQMRLVRGQYMICDLDSSGGTWVNGERIHQTLLQAGDVISLSGVPLVFGQDADRPDSTERYRPPV